MKRSRLLPLSLVTMLAIEIVSCAPPYLVELDKSVPLTNKITRIATIGLVNLQDTDTNPRLLPPKPSSTVTSLGQLSIRSGFMVSDNPVGENVVYTYVDSSGQVQTASSIPPLSLSGADQHYPLYQYEVAATTTTANLVVYRMDPNNASLDTAQLLTAGLPPSGSLANPLGSPAALSSFNTNGNPVFGESVIPAASGGPDSFRWFLANGAGQFEEISTTLQGTTAVFNSVTPILISMPLPAAVNRYMYYTGARSYLEYYSGGWICLDITSNTSPLPLPGISHRIDALLSSGDLLSTEGDTLTLYDPNGSQILSMPMGGLTFCYEAYVGSTPYVFLSLPIDLGHGEWAFNVYAVATSAVRGLGG